MTIQSLKYIVSAAEIGSITESAKQLHISQPSLSAALKETEKEVGFAIFTRSRSGIALTKEGKPLFFGIFTGYYVVQIICAVFVYGVGTFLPDVLQIMKYIGAAYILWLAIHIAVSKPEVSEDQGSASFMKGFLLQFVNIKIYMFGITALAGFITPYSKALWVLIGFELLIATIGTIATSTWIGAGILIQKFYVRHYRIINIILALTLLECIWSMLTT